jgi:hypothetical protein
MKTRASNVSKVNITLTSLQYGLLSHIIDQVHKCMTWDDDLQCYTDNGDFVILIPPQAMPALKELNIIIS